MILLYIFDNTLYREQNVEKNPLHRRIYTYHRGKILNAVFLRYKETIDNDHLVETMLKYLVLSLVKNILWFHTIKC